MRSSNPRLAAVAFAALVLSTAACAGRRAAVESEPAPEPPTAEDYYGTYDLYMGGVPIIPGEPAALRAVWTPREFVVYQGEAATIRTEIAVDTGKEELRIWDENTGDVLCAAEGVYAYEDDGEMISLTLISDPCAGRAESADGARLVRREAAAG